MCVVSVCVCIVCVCALCGCIVCVCAYVCLCAIHVGMYASKDLSINSINAQIQNDCHMRNGFGTYFTDHTFWLVGGAGPLQ